MDRREGVYQETGTAVAVPARAGEIVPAALDLASPPPGFPACANCGTALSGPFCAQCGQHVADYHQSVWRFVADFLDNTFCWDNKLLRTLGPLFRQPGFLTREFMAGRRVRYVHPLRLFLFTSAVCITLWHFGGDGDTGRSHRTPGRQHKAAVPAAAKPADADKDKDNDAPGSGTPRTAIPPEAAAALAKWGIPISDADVSAPPDAPAVSPSPGASPEIPSPDEVKAKIRDALKTKIGDGNAGQVTDLGERIGDSVKTKIAADGIDRIGQNISEGIRQKLSWVALGLLPVFALMLRGLYWRKDTSYFLHLVFSLHYHTFLLIFWTVRNWLDTALSHTGLHFLANGYLLGAPVYLHLALRQVYGAGQGTWVKVVLLGAMHLLAIAIGLGVIGGLSIFLAMR